VTIHRPQARPPAGIGFDSRDRNELLMSIVHALHELRGGLGSGSNIRMVTTAPSTNADIEREFEQLELSPAVQM
jgi:hypothetical protein